MKFIIIALLPLALVLASAAPTSIQQTWTLEDITASLQNPDTDPSLLPYLADALNEMMTALHSGHDMSTITVAIPMDLVTAPVDANPASPLASTMPSSIQMDWTLQDITSLLENPATNPALAPYLTSALDQIMAELYNGHDVSTIAVAIPVGIPLTIPDKPVEMIQEASPLVSPPAPVADAAAVEAVVGPTGPIVQIILNVNQGPGNQQPVAPVGATDTVQVSGPESANENGPTVVSAPEVTNPVVGNFLPEVTNPVVGNFLPAVNPVVGNFLPAGNPVVGNLLPAVNPVVGNFLPAVNPVVGNLLPAVNPEVGNFLPVARPFM